MVPDRFAAPGEGKRMGRRRSQGRAEGLRAGPWVLAIAAVLAGAVAQPSRAQTSPDDRGELEAAIAAANDSRQNPQGSLVSPEEEPDPQAPLTALQEIIDDTESLSPGRDGAGRLPPESRGRLAAAVRQLNDAQDAYGATEPDLMLAFEAMGAAVGELGQIRQPQGRRFQSELSEMSRQVAGVARLIAADATAVATAGGGSETLISRARTGLASGDDQVALGAMGPAIDSYADAFTAAAGGIVLDLDLLEENIRGALDGETVGYAYAIARDGVLHAASDGVGGSARRAVDPPETAQSPTKEMYTASIGKTISATALLKAVHDQGISVDEAIAAYLPGDWDQGEDLDLVTFRHLLNHTSGLDPANLAKGGAGPQTDTSLQTYVAQGSDDSQRGDHNYRNANYSLMRVLIPRVVYGGLIDLLADTYGPEAVHAGLYEYYVSQNVLAPAGISQDQCQPAEDLTTRTLLYPFPPGDAQGTDAGDWTFSCGATGWFLSAVDLGAFMAHLRFTDDILQPESRALMDEAFLGWLDPVAYANWVQGTWGTYRAHAGDYDNMTGCIMNFPSAANPDFPGVKVQVSLLVSSVGGTLGGDLPISGPRRICKVLKAAYDAAWVGT